MRFHLRRQHHRPGVSSVLAMLYLVLFASLAVGFYAATNTAVQIAGNERHARQAMLSAESGMDYIRYVLGNVDIPAFTPADQMWAKLCEQVAAQVNGTPNFGGAPVTPPSAGATSWTLPTLHLAGGAACSVHLSPNSDSAETVDVTITGIEPDLRTDKTRGDAPLQRKIRVTFVKGPRASEIFDYGVASRSAVAMGGKSTITGTSGNLGQGSVLSATANSVPLTMSGNPSISGDFSYTNRAGQPSYGGGTIAGHSPSEGDAFYKHIHEGVREPEFPTIDTSSFEKFVPPPNATGASVITANPPSSRTIFTNIRIKANSNPSFAGGSTLNGVIFIETPNKVTFSGGATINGVIVVQNNATGDATTNGITFTGNVKHTGVESLPDAAPYVVTDDQGRATHLTQLSGSFLLAPKFSVDMQGNANSIGGTMVMSKLSITGSAGASIKGSVINLDDNTDPRAPGVDMTGKAGITIQSSGANKYPAGLTFGSHFSPNYKTYTELQ